MDPLEAALNDLGTDLERHGLEMISASYSDKLKWSEALEMATKVQIAVQEFITWVERENE